MAFMYFTVDVVKRFNESQKLNVENLKLMNELKHHSEIIRDINSKVVANEINR